MHLLRRVKDNLIDVRSFGPQFALRHAKHLAGHQVASVHVPDAGRVWVRQGESDAETFRQVFQRRDYDLGRDSPVRARLVERYEAIIANGELPVIVDAGANVGAASLWFKSQYPDAMIVAVEPEPGNYAMLEMNVGGRSGIVPLEAAIGSQPGFVQVVNAGQGWSARTHYSDQGISMITVDGAVGVIDGGRLFAVKIDIEGFESDLFAENSEWIDRCEMVIIEPHDWMLPGGSSSRTFQREMGLRDFEIFLSGENLIYVRP